MKQILYLLVLLLCFAGCEKQEVTSTLKVARTSFENKTLLQSSLFVMYNGEKFNTLDKVPTTYGDKRFEIINREGETIIDTTLTVNGDKAYFIFQNVAAVKPVIVTELPAPPPPPPGPLDGIDPAPEGFMEIKIKHSVTAIFGSETMDIQVLSTINNADTYDVFTTITGVTSVNSDLILIRRPVRDGVGQTKFKFRILDPVTHQPLKANNGDVYTTVSLLGLNVTAFNAYALLISAVKSTGVTAAVIGDASYSFSVRATTTK